jgi:dTDP-glucose 4,6-dehydratase
MKILVTGGSGFIGRNFIEHIAREHPDYEIVEFSRSNANERLAQRRTKYTFVKGDITDSEKVEEAMRGADIVFHLAGKSYIGSNETREEIFETNVQGTINILNAAQKNKVRVIVPSSADVYGNDTEKMFKESDGAVDGKNAYSDSKIEVEKEARKYASKGLHVVILRPNNVFGPWQRPPKIIPNIIIKLLRGEKVGINGDGSNLRQYLYIDDFCRAMKLLAEKGKSGEVYNAGGDEEVSNLKLAERIAEMLNCEKERIELLRDKDSGVLRRQINSEKLRALGWTQKIGFDEGLKKTIDWYRANKGFLCS